MLEKQKVRFTYGVGEKQFKKYVKEAVAKKGVNTVQALFERLETRLDNVVYRLGWAPTRLAARQMVTHGHIRVDNKKASVPSYIVTQKQVISVREASFKKPLFKEFDEKTKTVQVPAWLAFDHEKKAATVTGKPQWNQLENLFNLGNVIEFYSR
jgi:small subunit ribosomal protein S4